MIQVTIIFTGKDYDDNAGVVNPSLAEMAPKHGARPSQRDAEFEGPIRRNANETECEDGLSAPIEY